MCWAFECNEGDLEALYWELSFYELVMRMKLKFGELNARMMCQYTAFGDVVAGIFGKKEGNSPTPIKGDYNDLADAPTYEMAIANINAAFNFG